MSVSSLSKLEHLELVAKVARELYNNVGTEDTNIAEFLINLQAESVSAEDFKEKIENEGAQLEASFVQSLYRIISLMKSRKDAKTSIKFTNGKKEVIDDVVDVEAIERRKLQSSRGDTDHEDAYASIKKQYDDFDKKQSRYSSNGHYRSDTSKRRGRSRSPSPRIPDDSDAKLYKVYKGRVSSIQEYGLFIALLGISKKVSGLVHKSAILPSSMGRVNHPGDHFQVGDQVYVKVLNIDPRGRLQLSIKEVDQKNGHDLNYNRRIATYEDRRVVEEQPRKKQRKRLTSPERWEIKQLIASGAVSAADYPDIDEEYNEHVNGEAEIQPEEDLDIEIREDEPPFLRGKTKQSLQLSPVKVVRAPDGNLNKAAMEGAVLAKERREMKTAAAREAEGRDSSNTARQMNTQWHDPMQSRNDGNDTSRGNYESQSMPAWKKAAQLNTSKGRITNMSIREQRESLPVFKLRQQLIDAVRDNQVLIVIGDTGSGKTTQITQYLAEDGFTATGKIACTQPRRVAATSVAKRVAEEVGCQVGDEVGYTIRFEDKTSRRTQIKYMTDGMLQRECLLDNNLTQYSVIMLDEAHERTIATDVLFGLLKKSIKRRPDLKIIVTSATLDAEKFSSYFFDAPIFTIPGRTFPVEIMFSKESESDYLDAALVTVMQIHLSEPAGDILLFLTGSEEIETSCEILDKRIKALGNSIPELIIMPVYASLPSEMQSRIFEPPPPGSRKVVIATNIAETSITIDGIFYVVDPGFVKQNAYDAKLGMDSLVVTPISQAQARQRAGRAGRTGPGKCYRLYTEAAYRNEMLPNPVPEIQRQNLSHTILLLKAMGIQDLLAFDFMDPPPHQTMMAAMENLYALSALDDEGLLTRLGRKMADFPMEPLQAKTVIASVELGCSEEVLTIVAMLSAQSIFYRPKEKQEQADKKKSKFHQSEGDLLTLLTVYNAWKQSGFSNPWCYDNFVHPRGLRRAQDVRKQLVGIMDRYKHPIISCGQNYNLIRQSICSGYFRNAAKRDPQEGYKTLFEGTPVYIHPSSSLFGKNPEWVIYQELVMTSKEYMREVTVVEAKWLVEVAPRFYQVAQGISKAKRKERIEPLFDRFATDKNEWRASYQRRR